MFGASDDELALPDFISEFRLRHALSATRRLVELLPQIEVAPSTSLKLNALTRGAASKGASTRPAI